MAGFLLLLVLGADGASAMPVAPSLYVPRGSWEVYGNSLHMAHNLKTIRSTGGAVTSIPGNTGKRYKDPEHSMYELNENKSLEDSSRSKITSSTNKESDNSKTAEASRLQRPRRSGNLEGRDLFETLTYPSQDTPYQEKQLPHQSVLPNLTHKNAMARNLKQFEQLTSTASQKTPTENKHASAGHGQGHNEPGIKIIEIHDGTSHGNNLGEHIDDTGHHSLIYHVGIDSEHPDDHDEYSLHVQDCFVHLSVHVVAPDDTKIVSPETQPEAVADQKKICTCPGNNEKYLISAQYPAL